MPVNLGTNMTSFSSTLNFSAPFVTDMSLEALRGWRERRDEKAARRLVSQLSPLMRGIAMRSLRCPWMAEDAVQTAWMRLFQSLETHELRVPPAAWAVMIIKGVCANMLRTLSRRPTVPLEEVSEGELDKQVTDLSLAGAHETRDRITDAMQIISQLSQADRLILNLYLLKDVSPGVVARRAGLTAGALRTRICRIRSRLRRAACRARP